jgi:hypothetical protein
VKLQDDKFSCGAVALYNALEAAGVDSPAVPELRRLASTSPVKGTSTAGICKALRNLSITHAKLKTKDEFVAYSALLGCLSAGSPVLLAVDDDTHWVTAVGLLGSRVLVADSADGEVIVSLERGEVLDRWRCNDYYEGVVVGSRKVE